MKDWRWIIVLIWISFSCTKKEKLTIGELRKQEIDKRVHQFISNKQEECHQYALERAISMADSLLKINAVKYVEDSLQRPQLPLKPEHEIKPAPKDTIKNRPFLE